jgi:hypothetical protein
VDGTEDPHYCGFGTAVWQPRVLVGFAASQTDWSRGGGHDCNLVCHRASTMPHVLQSWPEYSLPYRPGVAESAL